MNTQKLQLPYLITAQAQKEVTHNDALNLLDIFTRPVVVAMGQNSPPASPSAGDCYVVGDVPTDEFVSHEQEIACYTSNGWIFAAPFTWLDVVNLSDNARYVFDGSIWQPYGLIAQNSGEYLRVERFEEVVNLSGSTVTSIASIPDRALVLAVNMRVTSAVTGAASFDLGVSGDQARYGDDLGIALDTTNVGLSLHPYAYYADTALLFTANGGNFTGGQVTLTVQYLTSRGAWTF